MLSDAGFVDVVRVEDLNTVVSINQVQIVPVLHEAFVVHFNGAERRVPRAR